MGVVSTCGEVEMVGVDCVMGTRPLGRDWRGGREERHGKV